MERINRVTDYLRANLDESPSLEELARIACLSSFHFHRIFSAITGETVGSFARRLRLEKAARQLKYSRESITNIALGSGFSSSSTFSRSFRDYFEVSPSDYRRNDTIKNSKICKDLFPVNEYIIPMSETELRSRFPVRILEFPKRRVAYIRIIGGFQGNRIVRAFDRLVCWAKKVGVFDSATIFGMWLDDPLVTPQDKHRYEACITIPKSTRVVFDNEISEMILPRCTYGVTRASGDLKMVTTAIGYMFENWLIDSPFEPEHQPALEIFHDKDHICNWESFDLDLCIPIKPLNQF